MIVTNEQTYNDCRRALSVANRKGTAQIRARIMRLMNQARARVNRAKYGPAERYMPDFEARVQGIPCCIAVTEYTPAIPNSFREQGQCADMEFRIVDEDGYPMRFIERALTDEDREQIEREIEKRVKR